MDGASIITEVLKKKARVSDQRRQFGDVASGFKKKDKEAS